MSSDDTGDLVLGPATRLLWRSPDTVQLELGSRAVVVEGLPVPEIRRLASPGPPPGPLPRDGSAPAPAGDVRAALDILTEAGFVWPRGTDADDERLAPPVPRLASELTALAARQGQRAAAVLNARRHCTVSVQGHGRAGTHIAAVLAAAGVGRVHFLARGEARLSQAVPGGLGPADEGRPIAAAAATAITRSAPEVDTTPLTMGEQPDLAVLAIDAPIDPERRDALHAHGTPHLAVALGSDHGVVGPLVLPGLTSCLHCADLHRRDRDPAWNALAVQLTVARRHTDRSDVALATVVAGVAALQALAFLDGGDPACVDGTLELRLPDWRLRRRSWPVHPDCDCVPTRR